MPPASSGSARRAKRRTILAAIAASLLASSAWAEATLTVDMPSQPLSRALLALSRQAKVTVIIPAELTQGRRAPAVRGRMDSAEAVRRLLEGAPLDFTIDADGAITIRPLLSRRGRLAAPPPAAAPPALETAQVSAVHVHAPPADDGALWLKRRAAPSSDFLLDDDLRGLAEPTLAGAMQLLPGVGVTTDAGEGRQISVRGISGEFTRVRINGMEALATFGGAYAGGGTNRGRGFDFNVFPNDLFKQIRVQKTSSADIDEGSLGATVDLRTRSPFDARPGLQLTAEAGYAARGPIRPRLSAILSRTGDDGRLGVLLSASYARRSVYDVGYGAALWQTGETLFPGFGSSRPGAPSLSELNAALHPRIPRIEALRNEQTRLGLSGSLQWRPSGQTEVVLDVLYSSLEADRSEDQLGTFTFRTAGACRARSDPACGLAAVTVREATIVSSRSNLSALIAGKFDNVDVRVESRRDRLETIFRQTTLRASQRLSPSLRIEALGGFSRSDFSNPVQDTVQLEQYDVQGFAYDFGDKAHPQVDFGTAALDTASAWRLAEVRSDPNWVDNSFKTLGLDLEWTPTTALTLRGGLLHKAYRTDAVSLGRSDGTIANQYASVPTFLTDLDPSQYVQSVRIDAWAAASHRPLLWLGPDVEAAMARFRADCAARECDAFDLGPEPVLGLTTWSGSRTGRPTPSCFSRYRRPGSCAATWVCGTPAPGRFREV
jgi:iron complex outermembrane receptor protein